MGKNPALMCPECGERKIFDYSEIQRYWALRKQLNPEVDGRWRRLTEPKTQRSKTPDLTRCDDRAAAATFSSDE
jgi:hypothetical protein